MNLKSFLLARWPFIATFAGFSLLAGTVIQLDLRISGTSLRTDSLLYIVVLGLASLSVFLILEYGRHGSFTSRLAQFTGQEPLDDLGLLTEPRTPEQALYVQAWERLYSRLRAELTEERERGRRQIELITQWAHHMKTPVAVIDLELQRLGPPDALETLDGERNEAGTDVAAAIASIGEENKRLKHALQLLLNTVRLQDFAADFKVERVNLPELVRKFINDHRREFIIHRVFPRLELQQGGTQVQEPDVAHWLVETDRKWLRFVLEQIVSNALKYASPTDAGHGRATFIIRHDEREPEMVLEVVDNGIGIPPEDLPRVFDPFFTGHAGRHYPQSTGMGLYLAREVCRRLGHSIDLESTPGLGTRVSIGFPRTSTIFSGLEAGAPHMHPSLRNMTKT